MITTDTTPCKIRWTGPSVDLSDSNGNEIGSIESGTEGVLVYPGLAVFSPDLGILLEVEADNYEVVPSTTEAPNAILGGWDGTTITPELIHAILSLDAAIPTLVQVMNDNPELGPKVVQGVMAGMS